MSKLPKTALRGGTHEHPTQDRKHHCSTKQGDQPMRALLDRRKQNDEGFTLIELLLVIIILGILAAVVVFSVRGVSNRGKESACKASKTALATAAEAYYSKKSAYPASLDLLKKEGFVSDFGGTPAEGGVPVANDTVTFHQVQGGDADNGWTITYTPPATADEQYTLVSNLDKC